MGAKAHRKVSQKETDIGQSPAEDLYTPASGNSARSDYVNGQSIAQTQCTETPLLDNAANQSFTATTSSAPDWAKMCSVEGPAVSAEKEPVDQDVKALDDQMKDCLLNGGDFEPKTGQCSEPTTKQPAPVSKVEETPREISNPEPDRPRIQRDVGQCRMEQVMYRKGMTSSETQKYHQRKVEALDKYQKCLQNKR